MPLSDDDKAMGRITGEQVEPAKPDGMLMRLLHVVIIWFMLSLASAALTLVTAVQFVIQLVDQGKPNARLAEFGTSLGIWIAKAARYQTAASEVKPWPWTELD
jgi:hypothetical protein